MDRPDGEGAPRRRVLLRLLTDRSFGSFFWARMVAASAVYAQSLVAAVLVYEATGSASAVAAVAVAQFAPQLVLSLSAGAHADRGHVARSIIVGRVLCATGSVSMVSPILLGDGLGGRGFASIVVASSLVTGVGLVLGGPAMQSITPLLVSRSELPVGLMLNAVPMTVGRVAGPAIGAGAMHFAGAELALLGAALGHLSLAWVVWRVVRLRSQRPPSGAEAEDSSVRAMFAHVVTDPPLLLLLLAATCVGFGSEPIATLAPVMAQELGLGAHAVGIITAAFGAGAAVGLVANVWLSVWNRHEWIVTSGLVALATGVLGCGLAGTLAGAVSGSIVAGLGFSVAISSVTSLIQVRAPERLIGRVMALWLMGFVGGRPVAAVLTGAIADFSSVRAACLVLAGVLVAAAWLCRPSRIGAV